MGQQVITNHGNRMWTRCRIPTNRILTPDALVNMAVKELKLMGQTDAAEQLSPVGLGWNSRPWTIDNVIKWEAAILNALEVPSLSRFHFRGLSHVLGKVTEWLIKYVDAEEEDWRDYVRQTRWGPQDERD